MRIFRDASTLLAVASLWALGAQAQKGLSGAEEWLSTADRTSFVALQPQRLSFVKGTAPEGPVLSVDDSKKFQEMEGFGFALTGGSAELMMRMSPASRTALLKELFGTETGSIGISYIRLSIGSSDMNAHVFTYDDLPPDESDPELKKFELGPDLKDVVPVLREILSIAPKLSILGSPWSAPSWMKTNGLPKGGSLKPEFYGSYAQYFVRYLQAMAAQGIHVRAVTMQNEPLNANNTPSMLMSAAEQATFLADDLGPALMKANLLTEVILYDHNCDDPGYPLTVLADTKAYAYAKGSGFHLYAGPIDALTKVHEAYPQKDVYFTEQMVIQPDKSHPLRLAESVARLMIDAPRNWSRNVLLWNLAADENDGPHTDNGGCPVCQGALTLSGDKVVRNLAYDTVAQVSPFVRPGAVRIFSKSSFPGMLPNVAYSTPDHHTVLIVANPGAASEDFHVTFHGKAFAASLAAGDVATYRW